MKTVMVTVTQKKMAMEVLLQATTVMAKVVEVRGLGRRTRKQQPQRLQTGWRSWSARRKPRR